ncbi:MAG: poly-gamma-glutamate biosynthesis protein PgsC [Candidatus Marinimicrobia bacterium]|nr:poly-gamma-glutamate biosynthesis protein PgsC [Candidatus Neomarinimicrobiota bacterium]MBL7023193.1 poly-gamma-glutamate biosynthesis protein PgsC [Candidatus Neomarinimicrobiota bacterium]MBL7109248.1 poly-gamma-glutamate biosynthesis protein PgsC [Candidatus Neomarinimicrobiota bacterium]
MVEIAIGLGIFLSLVFTETLGVTAGGLIVPGYIALNLNDPLRVISTFAISLLVFMVVKGFSDKLLIYGKRRLVFSLLLGFIFGYLSRQHLSFPQDDLNLSSIGYIIPGLIASWMDRQGVVRTISVIVITASIVQLMLMIFEKGLIHNV